MEITFGGSRKDRDGGGGRRRAKSRGRVSGQRSHWVSMKKLKVHDEEDEFDGVRASCPRLSLYSLQPPFTGAEVAIRRCT